MIGKAISSVREVIMYVVVTNTFGRIIKNENSLYLTYQQLNNLVNNNGIYEIA